MELLSKFQKTDRKGTHPTQPITVQQRRLTESSQKQVPPCPVNCQNTGLLSVCRSGPKLILTPTLAFKSPHPSSPGSPHPSRFQWNNSSLLFYPSGSVSVFNPFLSLSNQITPARTTFTASKQLFHGEECKYLTVSHCGIRQPPDWPEICCQFKPPDGLEKPVYTSNLVSNQSCKDEHKSLTRTNTDNASLCVRVCVKLLCHLNHFVRTFSVFKNTHNGCASFGVALKV